jgi:hypothetical protein
MTHIFDLTVHAAQKVMPSPRGMMPSPSMGEGWGGGEERHSSPPT